MHYIKIKLNTLIQNDNNSTKEVIIMLRCPCPHNSKHLPLYSPFHSNLNVFAKAILPGMASTLIAQE